MIKEFGIKLGFPQEACIYLQECFDNISAVPQAHATLMQAVDKLFTDGEYLDELSKLPELCGVNKYSSDMVFVMLCARMWYYISRQRNIDEKLYWDSMVDLRCKLHECHDIFGVWGTFVTPWFKGFFTGDRFALGRMQFEKIPYEYDDYKGIVKKGQDVLNCHVPSSGPMTGELLLDSLKRAYNFFPEVRRDGLMPVVAHSWLVYPPHYALFPEKSNLRKFYNMFDIILSWEDEHNSDFQRIFNCVYKPEILDKVPADNTLRRNFLEYVKAGNKMGHGFGILLFDGEKIV